MNIEEAIKHFRTPYELCKKINAAQCNFTRWRKQNFIPVTQQLKINQATGLDMPIDLDKKSMEQRLSGIKESS